MATYLSCIEDEVRQINEMISGTFPGWELVIQSESDGDIVSLTLLGSALYPRKNIEMAFLTARSAEQLYSDLDDVSRITTFLCNLMAADQGKKP